MIVVKIILKLLFNLLWVIYDIIKIKNFGLPKTLNTGIKKSKGQFIVRVDADDWVHPEYLNTLSLALKLNDHLDAIACDYFIVSENQEKIKLKNCEKDPIGCGIMFKTQQLIKIGVYDEKFLAREEEDLAKRFKEKFKISRLPIPLYQYRLHGKNMTKNKKLMKKYKKDLKRSLVFNMHKIFSNNQNIIKKNFHILLLRLV